MVELNWLDGLGFEAKIPSGHKLVLDNSDPASGGKNRGPSPMETLLVAAAACTAMDVISILEKKRQKVTAYRIEIEGDRPPPGVWPRPFTKIRIHHILSGEKIDPIAVERAIELSETKYCSVMATVREKPKVEIDYKIE